VNEKTHSSETHRNLLLHRFSCKSVKKKKQKIKTKTCTERERERASWERERSRNGLEIEKTEWVGLRETVGGFQRNSG
jgi:hypothetical protein